MGRQPVADPKRSLSVSLRASTIDKLARRGAALDPPETAGQYLARLVERHFAPPPEPGPATRTEVQTFFKKGR